MTNKQRIYFRADGSSKIGLGHVIRSLALAAMLKENFDCHFIIRTPLKTLRKEILEVCKSIVELPETTDVNIEVESLAKNYLSKGNIVVLDGYHFGLNYQNVLKNVECRLVCIDDIQHTKFVSDIVINHAPGLSTSNFSTTSETRLLLGPEYALLRPPFLKVATQKRNISTIKSVFICFGGADFNNLSLKVLQLFSVFKSRKYNINMVLGGANEFRDKVKNFAKTITDFTVNIYENLSAKEMVEVMQQSECAIVPASSIMYEVLAVKMPVIGGYYVDNQVNIYHGFKNTGLIRGIGDLNKFLDYEGVLREFSNRKINAVLKMQEEIGISRAKANFIKVFRDLSDNSLKIRRATEADTMTYFNWANDPAVRKNSVNKSEIKLENHITWFTTRLKSENNIFYIFEINAGSVGQLRFDLNEKTAIINYSVAEEFRGRGFGKIILSKAIESLTKEVEVDKVTGIVRHDNIASARIFKNLGFSRSDDETIDGVLYHSYFMEFV